jgi:predicted ATPase
MSKGMTSRVIEVLLSLVFVALGAFYLGPQLYKALHIYRVPEEVTSDSYFKVLGALAAVAVLELFASIGGQRRSQSQRLTNIRLGCATMALACIAGGMIGHDRADWRLWTSIGLSTAGLIATIASFLYFRHVTIGPARWFHVFPMLLSAIALAVQLVMPFVGPEPNKKRDRFADQFSEGSGESGGAEFNASIAELISNSVSPQQLDATVDEFLTKHTAVLDREWDDKKNAESEPEKHKFDAAIEIKALLKSQLEQVIRKSNLTRLLLARSGIAPMQTDYSRGWDDGLNVLGILAQLFASGLALLVAPLVKPRRCDRALEKEIRRFLESWGWAGSEPLDGTEVEVVYANFTSVSVPKTPAHVWRRYVYRIRREAFYFANDGSYCASLESGLVQVNDVDYDEVIRRYSADFHLFGQEEIYAKPCKSVARIDAPIPLRIWSFLSALMRPIAPGSLIDKNDVIGWRYEMLRTNSSQRTSITSFAESWYKTTSPVAPRAELRIDSIKINQDFLGVPKDTNLVFGKDLVAVLISGENGCGKSSALLCAYALDWLDRMRKMGEGVSPTFTVEFTSTEKSHLLQVYVPDSGSFLELVKTGSCSGDLPSFWLTASQPGCDCEYCKHDGPEFGALSCAALHVVSYVNTDLNTFGERNALFEGPKDLRSLSSVFSGGRFGSGDGVFGRSELQGVCAPWSSIVCGHKLVKLSNSSGLVVLQLDDGSYLQGLSSGENEVLMILLMTVARGLRHSVLLLDEPELHLSPQAEYALYAFLLAFCKRMHVQLIVATHSGVTFAKVPGVGVLRMEEKKVYDGEQARALAMAQHVLRRRELEVQLDGLEFMTETRAQ